MTCRGIFFGFLMCVAALTALTPPAHAESECPNPETQAEFYVSITFDGFPTDVFWSLVDNNNGQEYEVVPFGTYTIPQPVTEIVCVPGVACLDFRVIDAFADGGTTFVLGYDSTPDGSFDPEDEILTILGTDYTQTFFAQELGNCVIITGACCVGFDINGTLPNGGTCVETNRLDACLALGGLWYEGEDCTTFTCPDLVGGNDCQDPVDLNRPGLGAIGELDVQGDGPITNINVTCGRGDTYNDAANNTCLAEFDSGEDIIYTFTNNIPQGVIFEMDPYSVFDAALAVDTVCPPDNNCIVSAINEDSNDVFQGEIIALQSGTYFMMIDIGPVPSESCFESFSITLRTFENPVGACCIENTCEQDVTESVCDNAGGTWFPDFLCSEGFICPFGACCVPNGPGVPPSCANVSSITECDLLGGDYFDGVSCSSVTCPFCDFDCTGPSESDTACPETTETNDGCFASTIDPLLVDDLDCNGNVCGTVSIIDPVTMTRDGDFYRVVLSEQSTLTLDATATGPITILLAAPPEGSPLGVIGCDEVGTVSVVAFDGPTFEGPDNCHTAQLESICLPPGEYMVAVLGEGDLCPGTLYDLSATCTPCAPATGSCCLDASGTCMEVSEAECFNMAGLYRGDNTLCNPNPCFPPDNDDCGAALPVSVNGATILQDTFLADNDPSGFCASVSVNNGVWYTFTGTGNTITVSTCNPGTTFDTVLEVYCDCSLQCVGGNDDEGSIACGGLGGTSEVSFCSEAGQTYLVHLGGFGGAAGFAELSVTDNGIPCAPAVNCPDPIGACCTDTNCQNITEIQCAIIDGVYIGDGTDCNGVNFVTDGGFETGSPNVAWDEDSSAFPTPLCTIVQCGGTGGGTGPFEGSWWCWFGGLPDGVHDAFVEQQVAIPADATLLTFRLEIPIASGNGTDFLQVLIDGNLVYTVLENEAPAFPNYRLVEVDLTTAEGGPYNDGNVHTVRFESTTTSVGTEFTNIFLDDVAIRSSFDCDEINTCPWDTTSISGGGPNGEVDAGDFFVLLQSWGPCPAPPQECPYDTTRTGGGPPNGEVDVGDFFDLLQNWGPCP